MNDLTSTNAATMSTDQAPSFHEMRKMVREFRAADRGARMPTDILADRACYDALLVELRKNHESLHNTEGLYGQRLLSPPFDDTLPFTFYRAPVHVFDSEAERTRIVAELRYKARETGHDLRIMLLRDQKVSDDAHSPDD